jgi:thiamine pyrophosphate-dependent acetolactate synthase large subunit-like protein
MQRAPRSPGLSLSRRHFIRKAAGAGAAAAATTSILSGEEPAQAQRRTPSPAPADVSATAAAPANTIRIPEELTAGSNAAPTEIQFPMTGAQVFARACKDEGVAGLFCCPGNYGVIHAIAGVGIPAYSGRHEGSMTHAADAFIRVSGEIAVASGTEGPGFTDMICGIACANAARTPLLVVASNMSLFQEDTEAGIQLAYQQPTTDGMKKYGKRMITPGRVHEYTAYAFRQLRSGVPRPVHLDFPAEVAAARFKDASELASCVDKAKYRTDSRPHPSPKDIDAAVGMLKAAARPIIVSSNGVFYRRGWDALKRLAEKAQIPVVESGAMKGQFPGEFAFGPDARYIRIDQSHEDIGRNLPVDLGIVSCERAALEALADAVPQMTHATWVGEIANARRKFDAQNDEYYKAAIGYTDAVHPAIIGKELSDFLYRGSLAKESVTVASGGYGIARYTRRWLRGYRPGQIMNGAYQYGAIGPDVGYAVGVAAAVRQCAGPQQAHKGTPVVCITGDAGFGYTAMELETLSKYRLPVIVIVYNNNAWGTWTTAREPKALPLHLFQENVRYDKLGEALGAHGEYVTTPGAFKPALERAWQVAVRESRPSVINCQGKKEFWIREQYPPGFLGKIEPGCMSYYH